MFVKPPKHLRKKLQLVARFVQNFKVFFLLVLCSMCTQAFPSNSASFRCPSASHATAAGARIQSSQPSKSEMFLGNAIRIYSWMHCSILPYISISKNVSKKTSKQDTSSLSEMHGTNIDSPSNLNSVPALQAMPHSLLLQSEDEEWNHRCEVLEDQNGHLPNTCMWKRTCWQTSTCSVLTVKVFKTQTNGRMNRQELFTCVMNSVPLLSWKQNWYLLQKLKIRPRQVICGRALG